MFLWSEANNKLKKLLKKRFAQKWLKGRKVYSLDLQSGKDCKFAVECRSMAVRTKDGLRIHDFPQCRFRCYSASQETQYHCVYENRVHNSNRVKRLKTISMISSGILASMPEDIGICRIHSAGDFISQSHFSAWLQVAKSRPDVLFYAYTKALSYWWNKRDKIPANLVLTASYGGVFDEFIPKWGFRSAVVVNKPYHARIKGLPIDDSDSIAADPSRKDTNFALLLHGTQPSGSEEAKIVASRR